MYVISGFLREVDEDCALLGCYAASSGNFLPTFRDNLSVPSSFLKEGPIIFPVTSKMGPKGCPAMSIRYYHCLLRDNSEEGRSQSTCMFETYHHRTHTKRGDYLL